MKIYNISSLSGKTEFAINFDTMTITDLTNGRLKDTPIKSLFFMHFDGERTPYADVVEKGKDTRVLLDKSKINDIFAARKKFDAEKLESQIPGITELKAAMLHNSVEYADLAASIERGDGVRHTDGTRIDTDTLAQKYPRAALYLVAEGYTQASNYLKTGAGKKAMEMLKSGCELSDAETVLNDWAKDITID